MRGIAEHDYHSAPLTPEPRMSRDIATQYVGAGVRIALGWVFLWAFFDKMFGWGYSTPEAGAWINGGHPTRGFLTSANGPFAAFYHAIAGDAWADWLFMLGLLGLGVALLLGIGMRLAAVAGSVLYIMMWSVVLPPATNLFLDDHLILAGVLVLLTLIGAGNTAGLGTWWSRTTLVARQPWLK